MVSVIIPVYNGEKYIARCLDTLLSGDTSFLDVIAVNDGSTDTSLEVLREYENNHANLRVIDKENGGAASARRTGILAASGEYIAFLDIDDLCPADTYRRLEEKAIETQADIVFCDYTEVRGNRKRVVKNEFDGERKPPLDPLSALYCLHTRKAVFPFPWNKIYRRELFEDITFPEGNFVGEDHNMLIQLFERAKKIDYLDVCGYEYELTENSASRGGYSEATVRAFGHFKADHAYICEKYPELHDVSANYITDEYLAMIVAMSRNKKYDKSMIKEIKAFVRKNFWNYSRSRSVPVKMKLSATALVISYRLLILLYRIFS